MENGSGSVAPQNAGEISSGNVQQHFSVPSTGTQAVSIIAQDPSKGVYIVDPTQQHAALQMFGADQQRLIAAAASSNQVELANANAVPTTQAIMVRITILICPWSFVQDIIFS